MLTISLCFIIRAAITCKFLPVIPVRLVNVIGDVESSTVTVQFVLNKQLIDGAFTLTILSGAAWIVTAAIQIAPNRYSRVFIDICVDD